MKKITNLLMLLAVVLFAACEKTIESPETLEVKPYNLEGTWQLAEFNGCTLAEGTYVYLVLDRKDSFEEYYNTQSMGVELKTGTYKLENDWRIGDIISGTYDYQNGEWNHEYIITDLYEESMTWTAKDDAAEVQKFVRVAEVPAEIVESARKMD
jgi:hypothetical protein